ncbi:30S ribosomal protein S9 [Propionibacterium freudenreichii]|nr:30S ribosomal protein S9 [Propionibacterium freudenreichii]SBW77300.1 30S ribosomal protein S9 [Propionibacterium freudenreichii]
MSAPTNEDSTVSQTTNDDVETGTTPFTDENNREIAYRADSTGAAPNASTSRSAVIAPGIGLGRRKEAVARVRLTPGTGKYTVNGKTLEAYFPNKLHQQLINESFVVSGSADAYDVVARIVGGGISGQAGALRLGIARALNQIDEEVNRPGLKKAGLLTRDSRAVERKKAGLKKARKAPQYSKR